MQLKLRFEMKSTTQSPSQSVPLISKYRVAPVFLSCRGLFFIYLKMCAGSRTVRNIGHFQTFLCSSNVISLCQLPKLCFRIIFLHSTYIRAHTYVEKNKLNNFLVAHPHFLKYVKSTSVLA